MVISEGLRLYPSVPLYVVRRGPVDTNVCGQFIPAGANVIVPPWLIRHHPDYWLDPDEFVPDRFAEEISVTIENTLRHRAPSYERQVNAATTTDCLGAFGGHIDFFRELIRSVIREELQKLSVPSPPTISSLSSVVRDEVQHALREPPFMREPQPPSDFSRMSYAQALRQPVTPAMPLHTAAPAMLQTVQAAPEPCLVITDPRMAHECFVKQAAIFQDRPAAFVDAEPFKSSFFQLGGNAWKYVRGRLNYGFSSGTIKELSEKANVCAARFVKRISSISLRNGCVEVFDRALDFTFDFIMNSVLAQQVRSQEDCKEPILESLIQVIKDMENSAIEVAFTVPVVRALLTHIYPLTKHAREFRNVINHVQNTVELYRSGKLPKEPSVLRTLLETQAGTLKTEENEPGRRKKYLDDRYVTSNVTIFLLAGIETTASLLSFLMYLLARHLEEQEKVIKEMEEVLAEENGELRFDKLHLLKRVDMVIYEGLRLYPPVPLYLIRHCSQDTTVCGQFIPAGVNVIVSPWLVHHDPDLWPDPDEFLPDRFAEDSAGSHHKGAYMPFGLGPRLPLNANASIAFISEASLFDIALPHWKHRINMEKAMSLGTGVAAIVAATAVFWLLNRRRRFRLFKDLGIPGPEPDFIWGNMKQAEHRRIEAAMKWREEYGKVVGIYVGNEPFLSIADPQMAHECFVKQADIFQDRPAAFVDAEPFKSSLFQLGGNAWKRVRTRLNYGFSSGMINDLSGRANVCAARFAERISSTSLTSGYVEVFHCSLGFAFDFIMNTVLAQQVKIEEDCKDQILESFKQVIKDMENTAIEVAFSIPVPSNEQEEVVKEMEEVLSSEERSDPSIDKLHLLKRLDMVIYEGLRLYPPVPLFLVRRCSRDTTVCGQFIPVGVNVMVTPWLIHRDPAYWPHPDEFRPDSLLDHPLACKHFRFPALHFRDDNRPVGRCNYVVAEISI
ncbi:hypothetical protein HPB52_017768 [Rhipicephalus sanguineus]|uniref:Cytochrome P450 n=1 Tax=Rhipicephalus sanguineus TaxID=34632 RepID=A0A9D4PPU8_RHISA|nr:hypothetical protein HPB52_017768 [Rhipicephalus sanguineus]